MAKHNRVSFLYSFLIIAAFQILKVLIQVNVSSEDHKGGLTPSEAVKLASYMKESCPHLQLTGFMTIGSFDNRFAVFKIITLLFLVIRFQIPILIYSMEPEERGQSRQERMKTNWYGISFFF